MESFEIRVPIDPLHVEIDGIARYRQAFSVDDLAALLMSPSWPSNEKRAAEFHQALAMSLDAMSFYVDAEVARAAFVDAAHAAGMHVLPDDLAEMQMAS